MRLRAVLPVVSICASALACGPAAGRGGAAHPERLTPGTTEVTDDQFAAAVRDLLATDDARERETRLTAVESRQMARAAARFRAKMPSRAVPSVIGGLYLVKTGELTSAMLGPSGAEALRDAAREFATRGDEGRARAMYELYARVASAADKSDVREHLDALDRWTREAVAAGGAVASAGALQNVAVTRHLLEPSEASLTEAVARTVDWIDKAKALRATFQSKRVPPAREEAGEALRALGTGALVLASIYLRDGDAAGALKAIDKADARELAPRELIQALEGLADSRDAARWIDLLHVLRPGHDRDEDGAPENQDLVHAAAFGVALQAYRLDPTLPEAALSVAASLEDLGMSEASPAILVDMVKAHPDARLVGASLAVTLRAMGEEVEAEDADAARRAFGAAGPILAIADDKAIASKLQPGAARVRAMMGEIELREGRLAEARALLQQSLAAERSGSVLLALARIERHDGKSAAALDALREALGAPDVARDPALRGEILLMTSDVTREKGDAPGARTPLTEALKELAKARGTTGDEDRARIERVLAQVLDRFGADQPARQALERSLDAAQRDKRQVAATVGQLVGRAFVRGDLAAARDGLGRAIAADLEVDDLVYYALWVRLLEKQLHAKTDGVADRIFASTADVARWSGRLAAFGAGQLKADELVAAAKTPAQRTEALFYAAMDRRAAGDAKGADDGLRQVMSGGGVDLIEFAMAREILSGPRGAAIGGGLPSGVALP